MFGLTKQDRGFSFSLPSLLPSPITFSAILNTSVASFSLSLHPLTQEWDYEDHSVASYSVFLEMSVKSLNLTLLFVQYLVNLRLLGPLHHIFMGRKANSTDFWLSQAKAHFMVPACWKGAECGFCHMVRSQKWRLGRPTGRDGEKPWRILLAS